MFSILGLPHHIFTIVHDSNKTGREGSKYLTKLNEYQEDRSKLMPKEYTMKSDWVDKVNQQWGASSLGLGCTVTDKVDGNYTWDQGG